MWNRAGIRDFVRAHWQALFALAFGVYSIFMIASTYDLRRQLRQEADARLVADNRRRAAAIGDLVEGLRDYAARHAEIHELGTYLINRDLGMSMRYGLGTSVEDIRVRFRALAEQWAGRWGSAPPRIVYMSEAGDVLIDTAPTAGGFQQHFESGDGVAWLASPEDGTFSVSAPVTYRGRQEGRVITISPIGILYRSLSPSASDDYRELIVTTHGRPLPGQAALAGDTTDTAPMTPMVFDAVLPYGTFPMLSRVPGPQWWRRIFRDDRIVVISAVSGAPLALVTVHASEFVYDHLMSDRTLLIAGAVPLLLVGFASVLYRRRLEAEKLQAEMAILDQSRLRAEIRGEELAAEIGRSEALRQSLAASEARWQFALEGARDGVWDWNPQTNALFVSRQWKAMRGLADGETEGRLADWSSGVHPDDLARVYAEVERCLRQETPYYEAEYRIRRKDGSYTWVLDRGKVVEREPDGRPRRMIGTNSDISARKAAETAVAEERRRMETTLALSPDGFVFVDEGGRVAYVNPAAEVLLSMPAEDLAGQEWPRFLAHLHGGCAQAAECPHGLDSGQCANWLTEYGELACGAMVRAGPQGNSVLQLSLAGLSGGARVLCLRDVTRETEVDRMKSEFLSTAAHELRSPMASILGFTDLLLKRDYGEDKRRELLGIVHQQAEALTKMLNELLDLARIEARAGKDFKLEEHDLCELAQQTAAGMLVPGDARRVESRLPAEGIFAKVDAEKFRQALTNVLSNAYKFSPEGGTIELEVVREEREGAAWAGVRVRDHGIGMKPEELARAGERFYRADGSGHIPGTGLGLALVKEIIQIHGGRVDIVSDYGKGTAVTLWLAELAAA